jgi:hypothetical protein
MSTALTLFGGIFGSVIASTATLGVAIWTFRATRDRDQQREDDRARQADVDRRNEVIAELIGTLRDVELEIRGAPFRHGRSQGSILRASMRFYLMQKPLHPRVAQWVLARHDSYGVVINRWQRWWWVLPIHRRLTRRLGEHVGHTLAVLVLWSTGDIDDEEFPEKGDGLPMRAQGEIEKEGA